MWFQEKYDPFLNQKLIEDKKIESKYIAEAFCEDLRNGVFQQICLEITPEVINLFLILSNSNFWNRMSRYRTTKTTHSTPPFTKRCSSKRVLRSPPLRSLASTRTSIPFLSSRFQKIFQDKNWMKPSLSSKDFLVSPCQSLLRRWILAVTGGSDSSQMRILIKAKRSAVSL